MRQTVKQKLESMLIQRGMFESQAESVMEKAIPELNSIVKDYNIRFDSSSSEYPEVIYSILFMSVKKVALEWIEENVPMAWYKPMFE